MALENSSPRKIVFVTRGLHDVGGIERVTCYIISMLAEATNVEYHCTLVALQKKGKPYFPLSDKVSLVYLSDLEGYTRVDRLRRFYKNLSPDLIINVGSNRSFSLLPPTKGFKVATWEHFNTTLLSHPLHGISRWLASKYGDAIITLTEEDKEAYDECYHPKQTIAIPNPITVDNLVPSPLSHKVVLAVGRLAGQKGFDRLIDAWQIVAREIPDWKLRIVGSGKWEEKLKKQIEALQLSETIELRPHTSQISQAYQEASIYAMSSRHEGFPLVLLEAAHSALPIVSFDCPRGPKDMIDHGKSGLLVPNGNIPMLAESLIRLIRDESLRQQFSLASFEKSQSYLPQAILPRWIHFIESITSSKPTL